MERQTDQPSPEIKCPECHELGVIVAERDESHRTEPDNWNYFVSHPTAQRCLIRAENRDVGRKAVDRYIDKSQIIEEKRANKTAQKTTYILS